MTKAQVSKIIVRQTGSMIGCTTVQKQNLSALGLRKINTEKILHDTPSIRGMLKKVQHLVKIIVDK